MSANVSPSSTTGISPEAVAEMVSSAVKAATDQTKSLIESSQKSTQFALRSISDQNAANSRSQANAFDAMSSNFRSLAGMTTDVVGKANSVLNSANEILKSAGSKTLKTTIGSVTKDLIPA